MFIEAKPQYKSLSVFDNLEKVFQESRSKYNVPENDPMKSAPHDSKVNKGKAVSAPKEVKQSIKDDGADEALTGEKKQPRKRVKV